MGELVHAILIIVRFSSLCGLIFGCGIAPELDVNTPEAFTDTTTPSDSEGILICFVCLFYGIFIFSFINVLLD
jgi:hypothetical protein